MDILTQIMQQVDIARYRQLISVDEYRQISFILQAAQGRKRLEEMSRRTSNA